MALVRLDRQIVERLEGRRWRLPSKIYSDVFPLYAGLSIEGAHLMDRLARLGYQPASGKTLRKGEYRRGKGSVEIHLHDFLYPVGPFEGFPVRLEVADGRIRRIERLSGPAGELYSVDLEPELVTGLFEQVWEERRVVKIDEVPEPLKQAVIAIEDHRFYRHFGVDPLAVLRAAWANFRSGRVVEGGSTLTQQLVKNLFLTHERTWSRKVREAAMAVLLEVRYSKDEILEAYLNEVYFGQRGTQGVYGVGEAAQFYFGKPVSACGLEEAALLAALIRAPGVYSPHRKEERTRVRRDQVLERMLSLGMISEEQYRQGIAKPVEVRSFFPQSNEAPYFVSYLVQELEQDYSVDMLTSEGLRIFTTLDVELQRAATRCLQQGLKNLEERYPDRLRTASARPEEVLQGALVALEPHTGAIRALVGGRDYGKSPFNRAVQARRQTGSLFKPVVYLAALEGEAGRPPRFTPSSILPDEPLEVRYDGKKWSPRNFNEQYHGSVTVRAALEQSMNCATVWLSREVGYEKVLETAGLLGLRMPSAPVPSIALGVFEASPLELVSVYGTFANHGVRSTPMAVRKILDKDGRTIERNPIEVRKVASPQASFLLTNLLKGVLQRGTARSAAAGLPFEAAGKTGTTDDFNDAWFAGYTPRLASVVWVGFDKPRSLGLSGAEAALPIWAEFMKAALAGVDREDFAVPPGVEFRKVDRLNGLLATENCPDTIDEAYLEGTAPSRFCPVHPGSRSAETGGSQPGGKGILRKFWEFFW